MKNNRGGRFLIAGGGGREAAFAVRLAEDSVVCAVAPHDNPTIADCVRQTGGVFLRGDSDNPDTLVRFAKEQKIDYAFVNADARLPTARWTRFCKTESKRSAAAAMPPALSGTKFLQ